MTSKEEIRHLMQQFPRSKEIAVGRDVMERWMVELMPLRRFAEEFPTFGTPSEVFELRDEALPNGVTARRLGVAYRGRTLTLVTP